ncbi:MAG: DUF1810 domain-containing protein [Bacteroidota bacterium]
MNKYDLNRFIQAQATSYEIALSEIKSGKKLSHWMWFVFPQMRGLGGSQMSYYYGIESIDEAKAYLEHNILGTRLIEISGELLNLNTNDPVAILGSIDAMKLRSSMTLFSFVEGAPDVFKQVLEKFFAGNVCMKTVELINLQKHNIHK